MPDNCCRDCAVRLRFFKKKFKCEKCAGNYCDACFSKVKLHHCFLGIGEEKLSTNRTCLRCIVLTSGKFKRENLFLLTSKQLTQYLTAHQIPTNHCKEKYHLIDMIMEFAEINGLKSGADMEHDALHRTEIEELRRAELMRQLEEREGLHIVETEDLPTPPETNQPLEEIQHLSETIAHASPTLASNQSAGKWRSMDDIEDVRDIYQLTVLELKQILKANFIDYRGCCEKVELMDKVKMLYDSERNAASSTSESDLCKICMDHAIDCVLLDCGHLVSCTKCGKRLAECPICRALVVRVVHIFRV